MCLWYTCYKIIAKVFEHKFWNLIVYHVISFMEIETHLTCMILRNSYEYNL